MLLPQARRVPRAWSQRGRSPEPGAWSQFARASVLESVARSILPRLGGDGDEERRAVGELLRRSGALARATPAPSATRADPGAAPVWIVCAARCGPAAALFNVTGALAAGCDVAVTSVGATGRLAAHVLELLEDRIPVGHLRRLGAEGGWRLPWPEVTIVVVTPTAVFLNDRPWVRLTLDSAARGDGVALVEFYRGPCRSPVGLSALPPGARGRTIGP